MSQGVDPGVGLRANAEVGVGQVARQDVEFGLFDLRVERCQGRTDCTLEDPAQEGPAWQEVQGLEDLGGDDILQAQATIAGSSTLSGAGPWSCCVSSCSGERDG